MAALTTADCAAINTAIVRESGRINQEIYDRVVQFSPWIGLTPSDVWPDGMGLEQTNLTFERMLPADDSETWTDVVPSNGTDNLCLPAVEIIKWGQTLRTWNLQTIAKETDRFCIEDLRSAFALQQMLTKYTSGLGDVTKKVWENRNQNEYIRIANHKVTEKTTAFDINATSFDAANPPTSRLTNGTLDRIYQQLLAEGAGMYSYGNTGNNAPVFGLLTDFNTDQDLMFQDPNRRADIQFAFMGKANGSPLIAPMGMGMSYRGYSHIINYNQPRYEIVGGNYVRVPRYAAAVATNKGYKRDLNPAYDTATYADTIVHIPSVYTRRIPKPITNPGGKFRFDPVNYMGVFDWKNILHEVCNPDGTIGFFRAVFKSGSEPVHPEYGYVIRHLNCAPFRFTKSCRDYS